MTPVNAGKVNLGTALVAGGLLLLAINLGLLDATIWANLARAWPLLLVALGLNLVLQRTRLWFLPTLLVAGTVGYIALIGFPGQWQARTVRAEGLLEAGVQSARFRLDIGAGSLTVRGGAASLYEATFHVRGREPLLRVNRRGTTLDITMHQQDRRILRWMGPLSEEWDVQIGDQVPVDLAIDAGGAALDLDLRRVPVKSLDINGGASSITIALGDNGRNTDVFINTGAANIELIIPRTAGTRFKIDSLLADTNLDHLGLIKRDDGYVTKNYVEARTTVDVYVASALARLEVRYANRN